MLRRVVIQETIQPDVRRVYDLGVQQIIEIRDSLLVGSERVNRVEAHLAQNKKNIEHRLMSRIEAAKLSLARFRDGRMSGFEGGIPMKPRCGAARGCRRW